MMRLTRQDVWLAVCGLLLLGLTALALGLPHPAPGQFGIGYGVKLDEFVTLACMQGLIYFAAVLVLLRGGAPRLWLVIGFAVLLRLVVVVFPPFLSNDIYRYIWDGWVQAAGINPYRYLPVDAHLAMLRDAMVYPNINRADYAHTIYPPAAEMVFFVSAGLGKMLALPPVLGMRLAMLGLEALGVWAMMRLLARAGLPGSQILIYAWNPLPVWEFAGNGHMDAIAVCFVALAMLGACAAKPGWSAAALGAAALTKFLPVVLLPALWRRWDWKFAAIFTGVIILLYAPYLSVGTGVFGFLGGYAAQEHIDSGQGIFLLNLLGSMMTLPGLAVKFYMGVLALMLAVIGTAMIFQKAPRMDNAEGVKATARNCLLLGSVLMAGLSPHYPWYYAWLLVPACIIPLPSSLYLVTASFLLYLNPSHLMLFWPAFVFVPFAALAAWDFRVRYCATLPVREGVKI